MYQPYSILSVLIFFITAFFVKSRIHKLLKTFIRVLEGGILVAFISKVKHIVFVSQFIVFGGKAQLMNKESNQKLTKLGKVDVM